tara:strand:+ start:271 stop:864 length:594 start_codon:yes stop_codon:yes gene_type:complete
MSDLLERPYIPQISNSIEKSQVYTLNEYRSNQSFSRDKHNKQRAAIHRSKKKRESLIQIYKGKPLFIFKLLDDEIKIVNSKLKNELNTLLEKYEKNTLSIRKCKTDDALQELCKKLNIMCEKIETHINKTNFIEYILKGYFVNKDNINLKDDPEYAELIRLTLEEQKLKKQINHEKMNKYNVKSDVSFADMLRKNLK